MHPELQHLHIPAKSLDASSAFYQRYFGFKELFRSEGSNRPLAFLESPKGFLLALEIRPADDPPVPPWFHIGFNFPSKEALLDFFTALEEDGFNTDFEATERQGYISKVVSDPGGNHLQLYWEGPTMAATPTLS